MAQPATSVALQELKELLKFGYDMILSKMSVREIVALSYEAGGVYPTLLGYAIGAVGTFGFFATRNLLLRLVAMVVALLFYAQCLLGSNEVSSVLLLSFAGATGVACTYVQVQSWKLAFAHVESRRKKKKKKSNSKSSKVVKED